MPHVEAKPSNHWHSFSRAIGEVGFGLLLIVLAFAAALGDRPIYDDNDQAG
jgi:hypothetical protein